MKTRLPTLWRKSKTCGIAILSTVFSAITPAIAAPCDSLSSLTLPDTTITLAQPVAPGEFTPPSGRAGAASNAGLFKNLPPSAALPRR